MTGLPGREGTPLRAPRTGQHMEGISLRSLVSVWGPWITDPQRPEDCRTERKQEPL